MKHKVFPQRMGLITKGEYGMIDDAIADKYGVSSNSLFREKACYIADVRGNMSHYKEVEKCLKQ